MLCDATFVQVSLLQNTFDKFNDKKRIMHLKHIVVAVWVVLHVKLVDVDGDASAGCHGDMPDTQAVFWVPFGVTRAVEGARGAIELPTTACWGR